MQEIKSILLDLFIKVKNKKINIIIFMLLIILFSFIKNTKINKKTNINDNNSVHIFVQDACIHCHELTYFINNNEFSKYNIKIHNLKNKDSIDKLMKYLSYNKLSIYDIGTPAIFTENNYLIGFDDSEISKYKFIKFLEQNRKTENITNNNKKIKIFGIDEENLRKKSLLFLTILIAVSNSLNKLNLLILTSIVGLVLLFGDKKLKKFILAFIFTNFIINLLYITDNINIYIFSKYIKHTISLLCFIFIYYSIINFMNKKINENENLIKSIEYDSKLKKILFDIVTFLCLILIVFIIFCFNSQQFIILNREIEFYKEIMVKYDLYYLFRIIYSFIFVLKDIILLKILVYFLDKLENFKNKKNTGFILLLISSLFMNLLI